MMQNKFTGITKVFFFHTRGVLLLNIEYCYSTQDSLIHIKQARKRLRTLGKHFAIFPYTYHD